MLRGGAAALRLRAEEAEGRAGALGVRVEHEEERVAEEKERTRTAERAADAARGVQTPLGDEAARLLREALVQQQRESELAARAARGGGPAAVRSKGITVLMLMF